MIKQRTMQTAGELLKNQRKALGKTVFEVSQETRIQEIYIKYIESNDFQRFDSPVFVKGFIKIYSDYLGLDVEKILALYRRQSEQKTEVKTNKKEVRKININKGLPTIIGSIIFLIIASTYFFIQLSAYQKTPEIEIITPQNQDVVNEGKVEIAGKVSNNAVLTINGITIALDKGDFSYETSLQEGINEIVITATNNRNENKYVSQNLSINYQPVKDNSDISGVQDNIEKHYVWVKISQEPAWVQLNVDGKQKFAQVVNVKTTEKYEVKNKIEFNSGKPRTTTLYIDGKIYDLRINANGTGSLSCEITDNLIQCE